MTGEQKKILNFNIGVLGHVDSGKTSLSKALSTIASTAAFDKNPESKQRGITLDLGFSSFSLDAPPHIKEKGYDSLQITLVDCPGHASLIKTIIGGAQIINLMMLVIDVTKGMQTQTAECLVIGQITCDRMLIVLNKVDMLAADKRDTLIEKMKKKMRLTLQSTKFKNAEIIGVSAKPGGPDSDANPEGLAGLIQAITSQSHVPDRHTNGPTLFTVDHCFSIKGQGTVMTGTVIQGELKVGDSLEIPAVAATKKVKSIQMFRKSVDCVVQGDRAGVCVTQFDPSLLERGLVCTPGSVPTVFGAIIKLNTIPYFKGEIRSKAKFHISLGHETVMAKITLFSRQRTSEPAEPSAEFDFESEYEYDESVGDSSEEKGSARDRHVLLEFERAVPVVPQCVVIGSKLDTDINANLCRLAFHGRASWLATDKDYHKTQLPKLKVFKNKAKEGVAERASNEYEVIVRDLFKKETNVELFRGLKVQLSTGEAGSIDGTFGQSGKIKVRVLEGLRESTFAQLSGGKKKKGADAEANQPREQIKVSLKFKRYMFDDKKQMIQS